MLTVVWKVVVLAVRIYQSQSVQRSDQNFLAEALHGCGYRGIGQLLQYSWYSAQITRASNNNITLLSNNDITPASNNGITLLSNNDITPVSNNGITLLSNNDITPASNNNITLLRNTDITPASNCHYGASTSNYSPAVISNY